MQIAKTWRQQASNLRLQGSLCKHCGTHVFPERVRCSSCASDQVKPFRFSGFGEIFACSVVYEAPRGFGEQVPYIAGLVKLDEGPVIAAMITDIATDDVRVGMRVQMVTRRLWADGTDGPIIYGYKFSPTENIHDR